MDSDKRLAQAIEEKIKDKFQGTPLDINFQVIKGYVKLYGVVDTLAERERIASLIADIPSIKGVDNGLTIGTENIQDDEELGHLVVERFSKDRRIDLKKIGAQCDKGVVILRGQAANLGEIEVARELAAQVQGVKEVRSLVKISEQAKEIDDISIVNTIESSFADTRLVEAEDVETSCKKGVVTFIGLVDDNEQREAAEVIAKTVDGVRQVINKLKTRHGATKGDEYLTNKLRRALNKDQRVSPAQVKVYVVNGTAYLSGEVYSIEAKKGAEEVARELKGIDQVINDITVAYH